MINSLFSSSCQQRQNSCTRKDFSSFPRGQCADPQQRVVLLSNANDVGLITLLLTACCHLSRLNLKFIVVVCVISVLCQMISAKRICTNTRFFNTLDSECFLSLFTDGKQNVRDSTKQEIPECNDLDEKMQVLISFTESRISIKFL